VFSKFQSRDLLNWAEGLRGTMMAEEKVHDAASAQMVKNEHERIKAEIESREDTFAAIVKRGEDMINDKSRRHFHHVNVS
jgi:spectrin beta